MIDAHRTTEASTVPMDNKQLRGWLEAAKRNGAVWEWCDLALNWADKANEELVRQRNELQRLRSAPEPRGELVAGAADMLALFIEQLMNGPPNGRHMSLRDYLTQWRLVQGALDEYNEVRKGGAPKAVAATECRSCDQLITERDNAEEQADKLADCIAGLLGIEIGEHSNMNDPWQNAIDGAEYELDKRKRAAPEPSVIHEGTVMPNNLEHALALRDLLRSDAGQRGGGIDTEMIRAEINAAYRRGLRAQLPPEPREKQDAARYQFLRGLHDPGPDDPRVHTLDQQHDPVQVRLCFGDDLDAAVDAAMRKP